MGGRLTSLVVWAKPHYADQVRHRDGWLGHDVTASALEDDWTIECALGDNACTRYACLLPGQEGLDTREVRDVELDPLARCLPSLTSLRRLELGLKAR